MESITYKFAEEFGRYPGGRLRKDGPKSGEQFRVDVLLKLLEEHGRVVIDLTRVVGIPASFVDEAFVETALKIGYDVFKQRVSFVSLDDELLASTVSRRIQTSVERAGVGSG